jgi:acid phosphatase family membrane protein YuiD
MLNPYLVVPLVVWAIAQFLKFILAAFAGRIDFKYLYGSGGMPSVHSAVVTSLAVTALLVSGAQSPIFGLTAIFAAIVMYDSFGVRRSTGEQAIAINQIIASMELDRLDHPDLKLREILGHKPLEVSVGAGLGVVLGGLLNVNRLGPLATQASTPVGLGLVYALAAVSIALIVAGILIRVLLLRKYRRIVLVQQAIRRETLVAWVYGVIGLLLAFLQYEKIAAALWVVWPVIFVILLVATLMLIWLPYRGGVIRGAMAEVIVAADKAKWLEGPNKKKRAKAARSKKR